MNNSIFTAEVTEAVIGILKKGNSAELKRENGKLVIVDVGFDPASEGYGKYYICNREKVEQDFAQNEDSVIWETN